MVIDTSALLAILQDEPERRTFTEAIEASESSVISAVTFVEASIVLEARYGPDGVADLDLLLAKAEIEIAEVSLEQAHGARLAFRRFGRGRHPARLNFGDCFSYALAEVLDQPLLFKGEDFVKTDLRVPPPS